MTDPFWWLPQAGGIVPLPVNIRLEPPPGSLRAAHGEALKRSLQDRVHVDPDTDQPEEER
jgi:hypothetical protein